jgi:hypothetical protein
MPHMGADSTRVPRADVGWAAGPVQGRIARVRIDAPTLARGDGRVRAAARVRWEGPCRGPEEIWFEVEDPDAGDDLEAAPEAFLLAAMPLAAALAEPRLAIDAAVCPRLRRGLAASMDVLARWYPWCRRVPVEAAGGERTLERRAEGRTGAFVSGGIDSLAMLAAGRERGNGSAPPPVREAFFLFGWNSFDLVSGVPDPGRRRSSGEQRVRLDRLGAAAGFRVTAVATNVRTLHPSYPFWKDVGFGAGMIATAHLFRRRVTDVWFASHGHGPRARPHASHRSLDANHSTSAVEVRFAQPDATRMEKVRAVAAWPEALEALQVCLQLETLPEGVVNCGRCEKCRRTALALWALGRLEAAPTLRAAADPRALASAYRPSGVQQIAFSSEIADFLASNGHRDLARAMRRRIARARRKETRRRLRKAVAALLGRSPAPAWAPRA